MREPEGIRRTVPPRLTKPLSNADIEAEIAAHLEGLSLALQEEGMDAEAAWQEAVRRFGDVEKFRAQVRDIDGPWERRTKWSELLDSLRQDLGYALGQLRKSPGFACVAVATLALGVGLTTAMFTVVNGVFFRPLPFLEPDRVVVVGVQASEEAVGDPYVRDMHYADIEREASAFSRVAMYLTYPATTVTSAGDAARMTAAWVTPAFLEVLGVPPALGSGFAEVSEGSRSSAEVILGDRLWRSRFGADPGVLGRTATLDGIPRTIVGVMPPSFDFPDRTDLWLPFEAHPMRAEGLTFAGPVVARLAENTTVEQASAELRALAVSAEWRIGRSGNVPLIRMLPLKTAVVGDSRYPLLLFTGAVALVLLISCTNVANLLLMRATTREQEIGLRNVLGAGRSRLVRQLLTESVTLAVLGGALGIVVAAVGTRTLLALAPPGTIPRGQELGMDLTVLGFTLAVSLVTGIAFGLAPAVRATRRELRAAIGGASRTHSRRGGLARNGLVVAELALAVILLMGAGLLVRSFQSIRAIDLGFEPSNTLSFFVDLPEDDYSDRASALALHDRVLDGLARIPGVEYAGAANFEPFGSLSMSTIVRAQDDPDAPHGAGWVVASPGYFRAMGISMVFGRGFTPQDDASAAGVVIVSRSMAQQLWPDRNPVGERLSESPDEWMTVVGVSEDLVGYDDPAERGALMYLPLAQMVDARQLRHMRYVVRTPGSPREVASRKKTPSPARKTPSATRLQSAWGRG